MPFRRLIFLFILPSPTLRTCGIFCRSYIQHATFVEALSLSVVAPFFQKKFFSWSWVNRALRVSSHHGTWSMIVPFPTVESAYASHLLSRHGIMLGLGTHAPHARLWTTDFVARGCHTYLGGRAQAPSVPAVEHRCLPFQRSSPGVSCSSGGVSPVLAVEPRCLPSHSGTPVAGHCVPINLATAIDLSLVVHTNVKNMDLIA
jgi:hypothetical protein